MTTRVAALHGALGTFFHGGLRAQPHCLIGQSAPLCGGNAVFALDIHDGARACFKMIHAQGGVAS